MSTAGLKLSKALCEIFSGVHICGAVTWVAEAGGSEFKVVFGYMRLSQNDQKFPQKLAHIHIPKGPLAEGSHGEILFIRCAGYNICTSEASV